MAHALIIGGGIAGPLTAIGLMKAGITATVYEAYPDDADSSIGAWLTVAVNGLDAMRTLGVHQEVIESGFPSERIEFRSGTGKRLGEVPIGGRLPDGTVTHTIKRSDLHRVVRAAAARAGVRFEYEKRLMDAELVGDGVVARFEDGEISRGDLLIGADGVRSRTRQLIDPNAPLPRYTGLGNVGGFTPGGAVDLEPGSYCMLFGKRSFFGYTVAPSREIWWFANPPRKTEMNRAELSATTTEQWKQRLATLFEDDRSPAADIILASRGTLVGANQYDVASVPAWHRGRMIIIGDAAHAAAPSSGQGVSMAAEDAVSLSMCLRDFREAPESFAAFEALRRPRVERVVAHGAKFGSAKTVGPVGRAIRDALLPGILRSQARRFGPDSLEWLFNHHIAWESRVRA